VGSVGFVSDLLDVDDSAYWRMAREIEEAFRRQGFPDGFSLSLDFRPRKGFSAGRFTVSFGRDSDGEELVVFTLRQRVVFSGEREKEALEKFLKGGSITVRYKGVTLPTSTYVASLEEDIMKVENTVLRELVSSGLANPLWLAYKLREMVEVADEVRWALK